jgi:hypothetical protein
VKTYVVVLDDIGTKIPLHVFDGKAEPHYVLETSPGNFQWGYFIEAADPDKAAALIHALAIEKVFVAGLDDAGAEVWGGFTDKGAQGKNRVVRVPGSVNTKHGQKFVAKLHEWHPEDPRWTLEELAAEFGVTPVADGHGSSVDRPNYVAGVTNDPVFVWLHGHNFVLGPPNQDGYASIICPWADEHTDPRNDARWAVGSGLTGAFKCFHAACHERQTTDLLDWIEDEYGDVFDGIEAVQASALGAKLLKKIGKELGSGGRREGAQARAPKIDPPPAQKRPPGGRRAKIDPERAPLVADVVAAILDDMPWLQRGDLPTLERTAGGGIKAEQKPTLENVGWIAHGAEFRIQKNQMSGEVEVEHDDKRLDVFTPEERPRVVRELLLSMCQRVGITARGNLQGLLEALSSGNSYHPLLDWISAKPWDGVDRITELCNTLTVRDRKWRDVIIRRWLVQGIAAWSNWQQHTPRALPHVLVFCGPQGCGKTSWFRALLPEGQVQTEAALHLDSMRADDQKRKVLSSPIVELGELETTFGRSEIGALKAFLSSTTDRYRMPYDRDVTLRTRCTIFGASVNDPEFLLDPSGARRFWVAEVLGCNWQHDIDLQQLWAQAAHMYHEGYEWHLEGAQEIDLHREAAERHRATSYAENLLGELALRKATVPEEDWTHASSAEIAKYYRLENNANNWRAVGRALRDLFGDPKSGGGKKGWRVPIRKHEFTSGYIAYNAPGLRVVK